MLKAGGDAMDAKKLGQFIAEIRKEKEMTQAELAVKLHVTDKAVSKWERGLGLPDINSIEPLAEALGISIAEVMQAERISADNITEKHASEMLTNAFDIVKQQRKTEKTHILLILSGVMTVLILLILGPMEAMVVFLPCLCIVGSIALSVYGLWRRRNQLPAARTYVFAVALILVPIVFAAILFSIGWLGIGPIPT